MEKLVVCCLAAAVLAAPVMAMAAQAYTEKPGGYAPGIELPEGKFRSLVLTACTRCHDLQGVQPLKGYWNRQQWLAMVQTMRQHGALLSPEQADQVSDYLSEHFGRQ